MSPGHFFQALRSRMKQDSFLVADDGNHTFLCAEQFPGYEPNRLMSPTDFICMGYAIPASIGVKIANPDKQVAAIVGAAFFAMNNDNEIESVLDGAFAESEKGRPVLVDVRIDYSERTMVTKGGAKVFLSRLELGDKIRFIGRAANGTFWAERSAAQVSSSFSRVHLG